MIIIMIGGLNQFVTIVTDDGDGIIGMDEKKKENEMKYWTQYYPGLMTTDTFL